MKGFKDSKGKFHPMTDSKGVRKSRDQSEKTKGVRLKRKDGSRTKVVKFKVWTFENAPEDLKDKILEKLRQREYEFSDDFFADYDGIIYDKKTQIADYDVFENYSKKYYDLDRGQYIQFPDLVVKDDKKLAKMLGIPESLRNKISFEFESERENNTELAVREEETYEIIRDGDEYADYKKYLNDDMKGLTKTEFEKIQKAIEKWSDLMHSAWVSLRDSYEYQFTDEALKESAISNEYEFDEDGNIA